MGSIRQNKSYSKYRKLTGVSGETAALKVLLSIGHVFLGFRLRLGKIGEIDLITLSEMGVIHCSEVRAIDGRSSFDTGRDRFPPKKILRLKRLADLYTMLHMKRVQKRIVRGFGVGILVNPLFYDRCSIIPILILVTGETQVFAKDIGCFNPIKVEMFSIQGELKYRFEIRKNL